MLELKAEILQKNAVKPNTPLWKVEEFFMAEQSARMNSPYTIAHYKRGFKKLYEFLAFNSCEDAAAFDELQERFSEYTLAQIGSFLPITVLANDNLQGEYTNYLLTVCEVSPQTTLSYMRDLKAIMNYIYDNGWLPPQKFVLHKVETPIKQVYTDAEIKRLLVKPNVDNFTEYREWVCINYMIATGNRVQSIINIKVGDVDTHEGYVNINTQKTGATTRIPLVRKMCKILDEYIAYYRCDDEGMPLLDEYLFCSQFGEKLSASAYKKSIAGYNQRHNVNKTSCHLFRHYFAKNWLMNGGDALSLQKMLGHSSLEMTQRYTNLYATDLQPKAEAYAPINKQKTNSGRTLKRRI